MFFKPKISLSVKSCKDKTSLTGGFNLRKRDASRSFLSLRDMILIGICSLLSWSCTNKNGACAKEPEPTTGIITMTTQAREVRIGVRVIGNITIDWGDGKKSNENDASEAHFFDEITGSLTFIHVYSSDSEHNIVIIGNVTQLGCEEIELTALDVSRITTLTHLYCNRNQLTALDVSKNTRLVWLECNQNRLIALDVSKNSALRLLRIVGNQFTTTALNDLFRTLPDLSKLGPENVGGIYISTYSGGGNPGNDDCDCSIAEARGWSFWAIRALIGMNH